MVRADSAGSSQKVSALLLSSLLVLSTFGSVVSVGVGVASAANSSTIEGTPELSASAPDAQLDPGQNGAVSISITNDATYDENNGTHPAEARERAGEARSVTVNISDTNDAPLTVETGPQSVGTIQDGQTGGPYSFSVVVDEDAQAGTYEMEVTTEYRHAESVTYEEVADGEYEYNESVVNKTDTDTITVEIQPEARFDVESVSHDVPLGGEGTVSLEMTNTGDEDVTESTVSLTSSDSDFYFGSGTATSEANVGPWNAGETKTLRFRAGTVDSAVAREYPIDVSVSFTDSDGNQQRNTEQIGIRPHDRTRFEVLSVDHDVPRDGEGTMSVEISHTAGKPIEDVSMTASTTESEIYLGSEGSRSATASVEAWGPNEKRRITFRVGTTENAINRSYPIDIEFQYTDADDNENSRTESIQFRPGDRDAFAIQSVDHDVPQNGEGTMTLTAELLADEDVSDVTVTVRTTESEVYVGSEGSRSGQAVLESWTTGEQEALTFRMGTTENAVDRPYPIEVVFEYTDADDNQNTQTENLEIRPKQRERFDIEVIDHDVPQNGEGTVALEVTHTGNKPISDVAVTASTTASDVYLGAESSRSSTSLVGEWKPNETRQLTFRTGTTADAVNRSYPIDVNFDFTDAANNDNERTETVEFVPTRRQRFEVAVVEHDVPRDGEGTVTVELEHAGPKELEDVSVTATTPESEVRLGSEASRSATALLRTVRPGETKELTFRVGTSDEAVHRPYPIELDLDYTDADDNDNQRTKYVEFVPQGGDRFEVAGVHHDVPQNGEGTVKVELRYTGETDATDVTVTTTATESDVYLGAEGSRSAETLVDEWQPGDSQRLTFRVGTTEDVLDRGYPLELALEYSDDANNDNQETEHVEFTPRDRDHFRVEAIEHDVPTSGEGTVLVEVTHTGNEPIEDVTVTASTQESEVYLGSETSRSSSAMVGEWEPDETRRLTYRVGTQNVVERTYPLELGFEYTDAENNDNRDTEYVEFVPRDRDHFRVESVDHDVPRDGVGTVTVTIEHMADKPITDVSLTASTQESEVYLGSESSRSATALIGEWGPNQKREVTFRVGTTGNAVRRNYPLELRFAYTDHADNDNQDTEYVEFRPQGQPHFTVESVDSNVPIAGTGLVEITLRNDGPTNATEATLSISSAADAVFFGSGSTSEPIEAGGFVVEQPRTGTPNSETFIGDWPVGETKTVYFRAGFDENAIVREYPAELTVNYDNAAGNDMPAQSRSIGVRPLPNQTFEFELVESELYVGEEGTFVGRVTNVGNRTAEGLVVTAENQRQNVNFYTNRYAIGTLEPGESATFRYRVGVTEETEHGPRLFEVSARYRDPQGNVRQTDTQDLPVDIGPSRDAFAVETEGVTYSPGGSGELVVTVTNRRNETLSDVQAKLFTDDPLDSSDDSAFIPELEPGESATITLDVSVAGAAMEKTYSASMDFRFDDARADSELSDTYRIPVTVERSEGGNDLVPLFAIFAVFAGATVANWRFGALDLCREWYRNQFGN